jgi:predicted nucleotidyltransferase component of viral defense system
MLDNSSLNKFAQQFQIDEASIIREYLQISFLNIWYAQKDLDRTYFKGGTAIRLLFGSGRFSEDLDFTTNLKTQSLHTKLDTVVSSLGKEFPDLSWKPLKTLAGISMKLYLNITQSTQPLTVKLDFSQRESVIEPQASTISSPYPISFIALIPHLSKAEILAEKIRAVMNRDKGRDIYDLFYLLNQQTEFNPDLIQQKLDYYGETYNLQALINRLQVLNSDHLHQDLDKFLPKPARRLVNELPRLTIEKLQSAIKETK